MDQRHKSYLRPNRRRWGLTQEELAFLIGVHSRTVISRLEGSDREPSLRSALVCALVFNLTPIELFPGLLNDIHVDLLFRATELYEKLQCDTSKTTRMKLDLLEELLTRIQAQHPSTDV